MNNINKNLIIGTLGLSSLLSSNLIQAKPYCSELPMGHPLTFQKGITCIKGKKPTKKKIKKAPTKKCGPKILDNYSFTSDDNKFNLNAKIAEINTCPKTGNIWNRINENLPETGGYKLAKVTYKGRTVFDGKLNSAGVFSGIPASRVRDKKSNTNVGIFLYNEKKGLDISAINDLKKELATTKDLLEKKVDGTYKYSFDVNKDGYVDKLDYIKSEKNLVKILLGGNKPTEELWNLDKVRYEILNPAKYAGSEDEKVVGSYILFDGKAGESAVKFILDTNKYATKVSKEREFFNPETQTRLENIVAITGFLDKAASISVRGNYIKQNLIDSDGKVIDDKAAKQIYLKSFSDDRSFGELALNWGLGSAFYDVITSDFAPGIEADAALAKSRGANFNSYSLDIKKGGPDNLSKTGLTTFKKMTKMYNDQIEATKEEVKNNF